ncbi:MAG: hypothetical protein GKR95_02970 [Gammaproteobacteria bacterium]|nr:hypothetical protein [Gammaproteobacteria bacterium]DAC82012.1 TPA_exp: MycK2 [uncultured Gammaproteobacteria bacterium]
MFDVLKENYFREYYTNGFVETGMRLSNELVDEVKAHYATLAKGRNDFPKFFAKNEHQAYLEGKLIGSVFSAFPKLAEKMVKKLYDRTYSKAVYCEQACIERVIENLLEQDLQRFFKTPYLLVSYDIYLNNDHNHSAAGIHTDPPNFHHFYETENDVTLYIPLVDLNDENGGRIMVLPESKLKLPGNLLLKQLEEHFSKKASCLDEDGYIDPNKIEEKEIDEFIESEPYKELMDHYKYTIKMAKNHYGPEFVKTEESKGKVLLWNNKNFHAAEAWKKEEYNREVYVIRCMPIYNTRIKLKRELHGKLFNNYLINMKTGEFHKYDHQVDVMDIPEEHRLAL